MEQAGLAATQDVLNEGLRYLPNAETFQRQGDLNAKLSTLRPSGRPTW